MTDKQFKPYMEDREYYTEAPQVEAKTTQPTRYDMHYGEACDQTDENGCSAEMEESPTGEWVRFADVAAAGVTPTPATETCICCEDSMMGCVSEAAAPGSTSVPDAHAKFAANTTTPALRGSEEQSETGRVKLSGVQDHADRAEVVGGEDQPPRNFEEWWSSAFFDESTDPKTIAEIAFGYAFGLGQEAYESGGSTSVAGQGTPDDNRDYCPVCEKEIPPGPEFCSKVCELIAQSQPAKRREK